MTHNKKTTKTTKTAKSGHAPGEDFDPALAAMHSPHRTPPHPCVRAEKLRPSPKPALASPSPSKQEPGGATNSV